ncbi:MAG: TlpA family protein disulfide reductase [Chromatiales bacterium]|nr:TlpA family protein disulfide reductase [Chromatiales bacterium]
MAARSEQRGQQGRAAAARVMAVALGAVLAAGAATAADLPSAPDFALRSVSGQNLRLSEYRGQPVLLTFWADWCGTCQAQLAELADLGRRYAGQDVAVLAVNIDGADRREAANTTASRLGLTVLRDDAQAVARAYDLGTLPVTLLVDPDGRIRGTWERYRPGTTGELEAELARLMAE